MTRRPFALLALTLLAASPTLAGETWVVDKVHTDTSFTIRHFVTNVRGRFTDVSGTIVVDRDEPAASSVEFRIAAASIDTGNERRDNHLRSADFFDVQAHPEIVFKSTAVAPRSKDLYDVTGTLTLRGVTKTVTLPVRHLGFMGNKAGFETQVTLNRKDYGILWNRTLDTGGAVLGDEVNVTISVEADRRKEPAPAPAPAK